jgi:hypothetical protein
VPRKLQNYIINNTANNLVFTANAITGSSTVQPDKAKPMKSGDRNIVLNLFDITLRSIVLCQ